LELKTPYAKMVACSYCGQTSYINAGSLEAKGAPILLADYGSPLKVGMKCKIKNQLYEILGRIRYDYADGFWDEWVLALDGQYHLPLAWLQEDEGDYVFFEQKDSNVPDFHEIKVGQTFQFTLGRGLITEKQQAVVNGSEGQLPVLIISGEKADFVDAILDGGIPVSVEYLPNHTEFHYGTVLSLKDLLNSAKY
jgi:hypothetical protein